MSEDQTESQLSPFFIQALGLNPRTLTLGRLREALGIHLPPEHIARVMRAYNDRLAMPRLPRWRADELFSPHSLPLLDLSPEDQTRAKQLKDLLKTQPLPADYLESLHQLRQTYPQVPVLYNLESTFLRMTEQLDQWKSFNEELLVRFPGYLYPLCALSSYYLKANQPEKVMTLFRDQIDLADFDPDEDRIFEAGEVASFYGVMAWYHMIEFRILRSCLCMALIHDAKPDDPFLDTLTSWLIGLEPDLLLELRDILHGH